MILRLFLYLPALVHIAARLQGMGIVKDSLPPVPEDKELRAKNRARNEEQKKAKEDKKAKSARKAQRREISAKNHREAEKAGLPPPDSPETSVSEIEGGGDNAHWLDELEEEEDDVTPLSAGGSRSRRGQRPEGGRRLPRGPKHRGADGSPPISSWTTKRTAPHERALSPRVPRRGKRCRGADPKCPHSRWCRRVRPSPAQCTGQRQEARLRRRGPRPPSKPPRQPLGSWGSIRQPLALQEPPRELQAPRRRLPPERGIF